MTDDGGRRRTDDGRRTTDDGGGRAGFLAEHVIPDFGFILII